MMKRKRNRHLLVRVSTTEKVALEKAAAALDVPASQLIRRGIRWALNEVAQRKGG